jgi:hypothetical protein
LLPARQLPAVRWRLPERRRWVSVRRVGRGGQHVGLADAPADAGALDGVQVDTMLAGQLAHQRRDVRAGDLVVGIG